MRHPAPCTTLSTCGFETISSKHNSINRRDLTPLIPKEEKGNFRIPETGVYAFYTIPAYIYLTQPTCTRHLYHLYLERLNNDMEWDVTKAKKFE